MLATGPQVSAEQFGHRVHPQTSYVGRQPSRRAKCQFYEPGSDFIGVDRLLAVTGQEAWIRTENNWLGGLTLMGSQLRRTGLADA